MLKRLLLAGIGLQTVVIAYSQQTISVSLNLKDSTIINRNIYGQFAEHLGRSIYDGFYKDGKIRMDIVEALKKIHVPNLRWPGGCFADQYHWRDGIGDKAKRPSTVNTTWGMVKEDNSFGTAEFLQLCDLIGCEPYMAGNVGTGTPEEMSNWIEYLNLEQGSTLSALRASNGHHQPYKVSFWGVGNESWGCGGNMRPEYYADLYKHYATFCQNYPGTALKKIISGANGDDYNWTTVMMKNIPADQAYGLSLHYYTLPSGKWENKGSATHFTESEYAHTLVEALKLKTILRRHIAIMDKYDPKNKLALLVDEWGVWTEVEPGTNRAFMFQQNSLRDALIAASMLNLFNNHASRVKGANLAQTVNVIHSLILTQGDKMLLTPTYHVFDMYQPHQDAALIPMTFASPSYIVGNDKVDAVNASASRDKQGLIHVSLVNLDPNKSIIVSIPFSAATISGKILTGGHVTDINSFEDPAHLSVQPFTGFNSRDNQVLVTLPAKSVVMLEIKVR